VKNDRNNGGRSPASQRRVAAGRAGRSLGAQAMHQDPYFGRRREVDPERHYDRQEDKRASRRALSDDGTYTTQDR
jgi:hypothetical protein